MATMLLQSASEIAAQYRSPTACCSLAYELQLAEAKAQADAEERDARLARQLSAGEEEEVSKRVEQEESDARLAALLDREQETAERDVRLQKGADNKAGFDLTSIKGGKVVLVERVIPGSPASEAGLEPGDTLLAVNGRAVPLYSPTPFTPSAGQQAGGLVAEASGVVTLRVLPRAEASTVWLESGTIEVDARLRLTKLDTPTRIVDAVAAAVSVGDELVAVNGKMVSGPRDARAALRATQGRPFSLRLVRPAQGSTYDSNYTSEADSKAPAGGKENVVVLGKAAACSDV